jgi:hypothetical protein
VSLVRANHEQACRAELHLATLWLHQVRHPRYGTTTYHVVYAHSVVCPSAESLVDFKQ